MRSARLVIVLAAILLPIACTPAPKVVSKRLNLYAFSESIPADLIADFEKQSGIQVNFETYETNEELLAKLKAKPQHYDVIVPSGYAVESLLKQGALTPLDLSRIPNYNNIDPQFLATYFDPGRSERDGWRPAPRKAKYTLPYQWGTTGFAFDEKKIGFTPASWNDLWRPDLRGRLVVLDDAREMMGIALLALGYDFNDMDPRHLERARDKLLELIPAIVRIDAKRPETLLVNGEAWAGVLYNGNAVLAARGTPNISFSYPREGGTIWFDNFAVPKDAPHPDAACAFIDYVLSFEASALVTRDFPYGNPNRAALDHLKRTNPLAYENYMSSYANPPPTALADMHLIKYLPSPIADLYEKYWQEVKERAAK